MPRRKTTSRKSYKPKSRSSYKSKPRSSSKKRTYTKKVSFKSKPVSKTVARDTGTMFAKPGHVPRKTTLGDYKKALGTIARAVGGALKGGHAFETMAAGAEAGTLFGGPVGGMAATAIGAAYGIATGHGEYHIESNSIVKGTQIPSFDSRGRNCTKVRHREYIGDVLSTSSFAVTSYPINPGLSGTFPWLAGLASNFEEYSFEGLIFEFRSTASVAVGTNVNLGTVILATEYNSTLPNFISKLQMENHEFSSSGIVAENVLHAVECKKNENVLNELYIRSFSTPTGQSQQFYDLGNFQVATVNCPNGSQIIGELWVSYDICLYKQKANGGTNSLGVHYFSSTSVSTSNYFGTTQTYNSGNMSPWTFTSTTLTGPIDLPLGPYNIQWIVAGGSTAVTAPTVAFTTNCSAISNIVFTNASKVNTTSGVTSTQVFYSGWFNVTGSAPVITFSSGTLPTSITSMDLFIQLMPPTLLT